MAIFDGAAGISRRREVPIMAYVGANGSGKSLWAVADTLPSLEAGRSVLSTVRLLDYENPRLCDDADCALPSHPDHAAAHPLWKPLRDWTDLLNAEGCDVILDEVTGVASARESMGLPGPVANMLVQLRRRDIVMRWTAPSWARADKIIRETTQGVTVCKSFLRRRIPGRMWSTPTLLQARLIDARDMDDVTEAKRATARTVNRSWALMKNIGAKFAYDTHDQVMSLPVIEGGRCAACGGRRRVPACECG